MAFLLARTKNDAFPKCSLFKLSPKVSIFISVFLIVSVQTISETHKAASSNENVLLCLREVFDYKRWSICGFDTTVCAKYCYMYDTRTQRSHFRWNPNSPSPVQKKQKPQQNKNQTTQGNLNIIQFQQLRLFFIVTLRSNRKKVSLGAY